ncbi:MAG: hypothetical protein OEW42_12390 [Acidimicrobiia bacterium]|nr:hypothetical protein [Acidimicrobiia bacterium]
MTALVVALAVVVALLTVLVVGLLRAHAEVLKALHELGLDDVLDPAVEGMRIRTRPGVARPRATGTRQGHDIVGSSVDGGAVQVAVVGVEHLTLVAFLSSGCLTCGTFWEAFADPGRRQLPGVDTRLVIVTKGPEAESPSRLAQLAPPGVTTVASSVAWDDYDVPVSPYFLLVDGVSGTIVGEGAAASWNQVRDLLGQAMADSGLTPDGRRSPASEATGVARDQRIDEELARAGIRPGDPRLFLPSAETETETRS